MTIAASTVWEVRTTGSDTNGGGYSSGGTDWSQQDSPQYSVTDAVTNGTTTITSATANFGTDVVGNVLYIQGGTGSITATWCQVVSRTNATTIVVNAATGLTTGTGATLRLGGALASPGQCAALLVSSNTVYQRSGTYNIGTGTVNTAGNRVSLNGLDSISWWGYVAGNRTRTERTATRTIWLASGATTARLIDLAGSTGTTTGNLDFDGNNHTGWTGLYQEFSGNNSDILWCDAYRCSVHGFRSRGNNRSFLQCRAYNCGTGFATDISGEPANFIGCIAKSNTIGFDCVGGCGVVFCIASFNSSHGFRVSSRISQLMNCISHNNTGSGFHFDNNTGKHSSVFSCISYGNTGNGFNSTGWGGSAKDRVILLNCAAGSNTAGNTTGSFMINNNFRSLSADPFINAASGDFGLNTTAGGGALCRASGQLGVFPDGLSTGYLDIGAVQSQATSGGGVPLIGPGGLVY